MCPNTEFFLVRIWTVFTQCFFFVFSLFYPEIRSGEIRDAKCYEKSFKSENTKYFDQVNLGELVN